MISNGTQNTHQIHHLDVENVDDDNDMSRDECNGTWIDNDKSH